MDMTIRGLGLKQHTSWAGGQVAVAVQKRDIVDTTFHASGESRKAAFRKVQAEYMLPSKDASHPYDLRVKAPHLRLDLSFCSLASFLLEVLTGGVLMVSFYFVFALYGMIASLGYSTGLIQVCSSVVSIYFRAGQLRTWWSDYEYKLGLDRPVSKTRLAALNRHSLEPVSLKNTSNPLNEAVSQPGVARLATLNDATTKPTLVALNGVISKARIVTLNSLTLNNVVSKGALVRLNSVTGKNKVNVSKPRLELWTDLASKECVSSKPGLVGNYSHRLQQ
ncbi:uncharacterized protein BXZ73DRAFT_83355 [Epithele typhae]|uniref:uncharacterized protein n=1 Tax=Epithele typhae TaxID=378194 RepID=UPI0020082172|nr:uncharacterized protein BXZ73DRAFT_83355 [Epithele typhae]KAH9910640.1 hypothetical protein BXZ73DRAFT_83355 [Epithele typhae]